MRIRVAKTGGFCFGVRRAMDIVLKKIARSDGLIYTYGPLIHNPQVIKMLKARGAIPTDNPVTARGRTLVIRSHGISPDEREEIGSSGAIMCDATCPRVARVQSIIKRHAAEGYATIIVGDSDHPEVKSLLGYTDGKGHAVSMVEQIDKLGDFDKVCVVAQTTQNKEFFRQIATSLQSRYPDCRVFETICDFTSRRQEEARNMAEEVDAMIVVGGRNSGNTKRLASIARSMGTPTVHVETDEELDQDWLNRYLFFGITAGASTPNWMIERVVERVEKHLYLRGQGWMSPLHRIVEFFVKSNTYTALGAATLSYASCRVQGIEPNFIFHFIACFYVFAMHVLNQFTDAEAVQLNEPTRSVFYERHRRLLIGLGIGSGLAAMLLALRFGVATFLVILFSSAIGIAYRIKIVPVGWSPPIRFRSLKDIPASKDIFVTLGWATATVVLPLFSFKEVGLTLATVMAFLFVSILVFVRSVLRDLKDMQGDMIVGRETIPTIVGPRRTQTMLAGLLLFLVGSLATAAAKGWTTGLSYYLLIPTIYSGICLYFFQHKTIRRGLAYHLSIDFAFVLAAIVAYLWSLSIGGTATWPPTLRSGPSMSF